MFQNIFTFGAWGTWRCISHSASAADCSTSCWGGKSYCEGSCCCWYDLAMAVNVITDTCPVSYVDCWNLFLVYLHVYLHI